ncbi:putative acetyltransferase, GNAT [Streptomyces spiroverticillatus]|uniref:Acetyltransferase, GNAT n=1 Tax=Streptomyces finlayi TaxID=67296 RepID=A0A918WX01_9ACTN|nr:N-acetyltransferase [Streptomyces finlayi]GHA08944.1 putative acetyltransferase, GNAT [Streptomyces spiroverticillatus]GHC91773.1 putative acetyltransferase, GNAT [Streptomyces finlayi]
MSGTTPHSPELRALRDRVTAPSTVSLPAAGDGLTWRPATTADIGLILDLAHAAGKIDHPRSLVTRDELEEEFRGEAFTPERDAVIAVDAAGRAAAYGSATAPASQETVVWVELNGIVAPNRRREGIGTALLAWQEARGLQHLAASDATLPGWLASDAQDHATPAIRLLETHGYERARWWLELERDLAAPAADPPSAPGVRLVPYTEKWSERARSAMNDAFRDHWGSQPVTAAEWASGHRLEAFRPDLSVLAVASGPHRTERVVGFVFVDVEPDEWPLRGGPFGYVSTVGVRREARGQGLARTMLARVMRALRADGLDHAVLNVDAESPTGALGLYQSLGFTVTDRAVSLVKRF